MRLFLYIHGVFRIFANNILFYYNKNDIINNGKDYIDR